MRANLYGADMSIYSDDTIAKLRAVVDVIGHEVAQSPSTPVFHAAWTELVALLALGIAPAMRECPACHAMGFRDASRCSRCWGRLAPLPGASPVALPVQP